MFRRALILLAVAGLAQGACTTSPDTGDVVAAQPGATQPAGNGQSMPEADACKALTTALSDQASALHCGTSSYSCPDYIRPAGGQICSQYDKGSVEACAAVIKKYTSCDDFSNHPCIVTALVCSDAGAGAGGSGTGGSGAGGSAGVSDAGTG